MENVASQALAVYAREAGNRSARLALHECDVLLTRCEASKSHDSKLAEVGGKERFRDALDV